MLLRENYLDFGSGDWDYRIGRQQIVWGEMVGLFLADVVSAKDLREFILPDFDQIRIPQWAGRAEYFKGDFHAEAIWIPVPSYDDIGKPGAEFFPGAPPPPPGYATLYSNEQFPRRTLGADELRAAAVLSLARLGHVRLLLPQHGRPADVLSPDRYDSAAGVRVPGTARQDRPARRDAIEGPGTRGIQGRGGVHRRPQLRRAGPRAGRRRRAPEHPRPDRRTRFRAARRHAARPAALQPDVFRSRPRHHSEAQRAGVHAAPEPQVQRSLRGRDAVGHELDAQ